MGLNFTVVLKRDFTVDQILKMQTNVFSVHGVFLDCVRFFPDVCSHYNLVIFF